MPALAQIVQRAKAVDARWFASHRVANLESLSQLLAKKKLTIADVGAADGPEIRWQAALPVTRFVTFEPNPRPGTPTDAIDQVNFPIGLWSTKCHKTLNLTKHPDSSSLCQLNFTLLDDFQARNGVEPSGTTELDLDTLDNCLADRPELAPDFLKVDVEGGDLEVLKGSSHALMQSVLGIRAEAPLVEIHHGAPALWDIYAHLRPMGFVLFHFSRVQWVRNNGLLGYSSQPQMIWGDAVFLLSRPAFLQRLQACASFERTSLLTRFVLILLCHGIHDYAIEVIDAAATAQLVPESHRQTLRASVFASADTSLAYFLKLGAGVLIALGGCLITLPFAGARSHARYYLKQRVGRLAYDVWRFASRGGRPSTAALEDPFL